MRAASTRLRAAWLAALVLMGQLFPILVPFTATDAWPSGVQDRSLEAQSSGGGGAYGPSEGLPRAPFMHTCMRIGEASHPGPQREVAISSINVTALFKSAELVSQLGSSIVALQELAVSKEWAKAAQAKMGGLGYALVLSGPAPEAERVTGGVGLAIKRPLGFHKLVPRTQAFQEAHDQGRAIMIMASLGPKSPAIIVSFYAWVGGRGYDPRPRNSGLMNAIAQELQEYPAMPHYILGDLQGCPSRLRSVSWLLQAGIWHDIGHRADAWQGGKADCPTAYGHGAKQATRLDFCFCNEHALHSVQKFTVGQHGLFDVHAPIHLVIRADTPQPVENFVMAKAIDASLIPSMAVAHACMDRHLDSSQAEMAQALATGDTTSYLRLWSACATEGLLDASEIPLNSRAAYRGKGAPNIAKAIPQWVKETELQPPQAPVDEEETIPVHGKMLVLQRCYRHLAALAYVGRPAAGSPWGAELFNCWHAIQRRARALGTLAPPVPDLTPHGSSWTRISLAAKLAASAIAERARDLELQRRTEKRKALAARVSAKKGGLREAYKLLRDAPPGKAGVP